MEHESNKAVNAGGGVINTFMFFLELDCDTAFSDGIGSEAGVCVVYVLWSHLLYDCCLSDHDLCKQYILHSGARKGIQATLNPDKHFACK